MNMKDKLKEYPDNHFAALVTKPPKDVLELSEMIKDDYESDWNHIDRVMKPGAHLVVLTDDNYANVCADLRLVDFEIRDTIQVLHETDVSQSKELFDYIVKLVMPPVKSVLLDPYQKGDILKEAVENLGHIYVGFPLE